MKSSDSKDETVQEKLQSRNIREMLPGQVWLLAIVLLLERFTFFGITAPLRRLIAAGKVIETDQSQRITCRTI